MLPSFLITFREVIEASLIVATVLGILIKLGQTRAVKTVWFATAAATTLSFLLLGIGSVLGLKVQEFYTGKTEEIIGGSLMILSAIFITWAVFFLHKYFSKYKVILLTKIKNKVENQEQRGLFLLVFTAVFREGFEIVLFLTTIYLSSNPNDIFAGFAGGMIGGLLVSIALFTATLRLPVFLAFRATSVLLILFAAGLLSRGIGEFAHAGAVPELIKISLPLLPQKGTFLADILKSVFGVTQTMDVLQLTLYVSYSAVMYWYVFLRSRNDTNRLQSN